MSSSSWDFHGTQPLVFWEKEDSLLVACISFHCSTAAVKGPHGLVALMSRAVSTGECSEPPPTPAWGIVHLLPTWKINPVCNHHLLVRTEFKDDLCHRTLKLLSKVWARLISGCFCFVLLILPGQLPIREREEGKGDGGKGEEEWGGGEKKKKRKIRSAVRGGEREGRRQDSIGDTCLCIAANSLISILLPLLVSITLSGSLKGGGYQ